MTVLNRELTRVAHEISAMANAQDVDAARAYLNAAMATGSRAALATPAAAHLIRKYEIRRLLGPIARQIVADHP